VSSRVFQLSSRTEMSGASTDGIQVEDGWK
jgi:hypothetical protein